MQICHQFLVKRAVSCRRIDLLSVVQLIAYYTFSIVVGVACGVWPCKVFNQLAVFVTKLEHMTWHINGHQLINCSITMAMCFLLPLFFRSCPFVRAFVPKQCQTKANETNFPMSNIQNNQLMATNSGNWQSVPFCRPCPHWSVTPLSSGHSFSL